MPLEPRPLLPSVLLAAVVTAPGCYQGSTIDLSPFETATSGAGPSEDDGTEDDGAEGSGSTGGEPAFCETRAGPQRLRRLTRSAYANAVEDLLGQPGDVADSFEADGVVAKTFASNADVLPSDLSIENYQRAAESLAAGSADALDSLAACDPELEGGEVCASRLIERLGRRAWRRPLSSAERERLLALWSTADDFRSGGVLVVEALLQSPYFLYQLEVGVPTDEAGGERPLSEYELATRISMLVWNSIPDAVLLDAAEAGALSTEDGILAEVDRMLDDPRARRSISHFATQWVGLPDLPPIAQVEKNVEVFPGWTRSLRDAMATENALLVDYLARGEGTTDDLLKSPVGFVNDELAEHYGIDIAEAAVGAPEVEGLPEGFHAVLFDPSLRPGLLTRAGTMAMLAKPNATGPVHRGAFVQERLFCRELKPAPPGVDVDPPEPDPNVPRREQYAQHSANPECAGCHVFTDPIGFGLERYDATGALQFALDNGTAIDVSGELVGTDVDGPFDGPAELSARMLDSRTIRACAAKTWFRYAFAADERMLDECTIERLTDALDEGATLRELIGTIAVSHAFRHISAE